ncbi:hypothetical protein JW930_00195 [Candidatus Woesearchaeota archaeon]|nr:hypothetical protein [Candidatus Woesearchaeota archaeon]
MVQPTAQGSPINLILQMRQQGLSNNQIIQNLQRQGYSNTQIFDAMNQAEVKNAVEKVPPEFISQQPEYPIPSGQPPMSQQMSAQTDDDYHQEDTAKTEELIEAIIDEKWSDLLKNVNKIIEWKNRAESRIAAMEMKVDNLKENFDQLHRAVLGKIGEYDKNILDVGTEIKAMEKVFAKVLPAFTENVHELSRITDRLKSGESE